MPRPLAIKVTSYFEHHKELPVLIFACIFAMLNFVAQRFLTLLIILAVLQAKLSIYLAVTINDLLHCHNRYFQHRYKTFIH